MPVKCHQSLTGGCLLVNPNNPTGAVHSKDTLEEIVKIAKENNRFVISDEIYENIIYNGAKMVPLSDVIEDVPGIALKGISKEMPWPGARCGWAEFYNIDRDSDFAELFNKIFGSKMLQVGSTALPQAVIPRVFSDPRYEKHLNEMSKIYEQRSLEAYDLIGSRKGVTIVKPKGGLYISVVFDDGVLNKNQRLPIKNTRVNEFVSNLASGDISDDVRFTYFLMGGSGICVSPLSGFETKLNGFRMTVLEADDKIRGYIYKNIAEAIDQYLNSA